MSAVAYTDGACLSNPDGPGGWAFVVQQSSGVITHRSGHMPSTTNNRAELTAVIEAIKFMPEDEKFTIYSDSKYVIQGITEWVDGWRKRGWVKKNGDEVKNSDLWQKLDCLADKRITFRWIKGHNGNTLNEMADSLAESAAAA